MKQNSTKDINDTKENDKKKEENKDINNDL